MLHLWQVSVELGAGSGASSIQGIALSFLWGRQPFGFPFLVHELQLRRWKTLILVSAQ